MTTRTADGLENWRKGVRKKKREDIVSAALELFRKGGYHDTSVVTLSKLAGASTATIYKHFSSKEEILAACIETRLLKKTDGSVETNQAEVFLEEVARATLKEIILPHGYGDATKALKAFVSKYNAHGVSPV